MDSARIAESKLEDSHLQSAISYALNQSIGVIDENRNVVSNSNEILKSWSDDINKSQSRPNANLAWHLVFSIDEIPNDENLAILQKSVWESLEILLGGEYKFIIAPHAHQNKAHCHIILNKTNTFTKKKLHFKSKSEISEFFFDLREQFCYALCANSRGRFRYTNLRSVERDFYTKKIKKLESPKEIERFDFDKTLDKISLDLRKKEAVLANNNDAIAKTIKSLSDTMRNATTPLSLIDNKQYDEIWKEIKARYKQYCANDKNLARINHKLESIKLFNQTTRNNLNAISELKKQEILLKSFKGMPLLSKEISAKLINLAKENKRITNARLNNNLASDFNANVDNLNDKTSLFILKPMQDNLKRYAKFLRDSDIDDISKANAFRNIAQNLKKLQALSQQRIAFLLHQIQSARSKEQSIDEKYRNRFIKNMTYMLKEISFGAESLSRKDKAFLSNLRTKYNAPQSDKTIAPNHANNAPNMTNAKSKYNPNIRLP